MSNDESIYAERRPSYTFRLDHPVERLSEDQMKKKKTIKDRLDMYRDNKELRNNLLQVWE